MENIREDLEHFAESSYEQNILSILSVQDPRKHYAISIDTMSLFSECVLFAYHLFETPLKTLDLLNQAFQKAASNIWKAKTTNSNIEINTVNLHARLIAFPNLPEIYRLVFPSCSDAGHFMCLCGTVIRTTASKMIEFRKLWKCNKCKYTFTIDAEVDQGYVCEKPYICPNPEWCNGKNFTLLSRDVDPTFCKDYQEIKIQEQAYNLAIGSVPRSMWIILEDDLVDTCQPGNDIIVSGVLIQRWKPLIKGKPIDIDLMLLAQNIEVKNKRSPDVFPENLVGEFKQFWSQNQSNPLKGRDFILSSICPQIFGLYVVKLAVALVLAGGVEKKDENTRIRGDSHLLLVGDPGTGKSQFLKFATKVSMRSVLTSGVGTTNAGLTVSAVKETGKWQLEAGALVLADGGICCIDEFSCIKEQDKTCIHEAMEQQTISVAKAGLVCSLSTRCSILAVTNPKGKYDKQMSLSENTALGSPLLSRFDIILVLLDTHDEKWDDMVSSYILKGSSLLDRNSNGSLWSVTKMRNYFNIIRLIKPKVTPACERVLQTYYKRQRSLQERNVARTTPRLLQSLIRLAEGHAKLMFRLEVLIVDAVIAILLMELSMSGSSILESLNTLHTSFPDDPKAEYENRAETVLKFLNLENLFEESKTYSVESEVMSTSVLLSEIIGTKNHKKDCIIEDNYSLVSQRYKSSNSNLINFDKTSIKKNDNSQIGISNCTVETFESKNPIDILELIMSSNRNQNSNIENTAIKKCDNYQTEISHSIVETSESNPTDILKIIMSSNCNQNNEAENTKQDLLLEKELYNSLKTNNEITTLSNLDDFLSDTLETEDSVQNFGRIFKKGKLKRSGNSNKNLISEKQVKVIANAKKSPPRKKIFLNKPSTSKLIQLKESNIKNKTKEQTVAQYLELVGSDICETPVSNKIKPILNTFESRAKNSTTSNSSLLNEICSSKSKEEPDLKTKSDYFNNKKSLIDRFQQYRRKPVTANSVAKKNDYQECQPGPSNSTIASIDIQPDMSKNIKVENSTTVMHNKSNATMSSDHFANERKKTIAEKLSSQSVFKRVFSNTVDFSDFNIDIDFMDIIE